MPYTITRFLMLATVLLLSMSTSAIELSPEEEAFLQANPVIRVGGESDWPPLDYVENGEYKGAARDYLNEVSRISGIEFDIVIGKTWGSLMDQIRGHEIDVLPMMFWTDNRGHEFHMTLPYITVRHYVYMKGTRPDIKRLEDLTGKTMAIPRGYASIEYLSEHYPDISILVVDGVVDAMDAVLVGSADAVIENTASLSYHASRQNIVGLTPAFPVKFESNNIAMAVRNDWPLLRDILQKSLNEISRDSTTAIMNKWAGSEISAKTFLTTTAEYTNAESRFLSDRRRLIACINTNRMPLESARKDIPQGMTSDFLRSLGDSMKVHFTVNGYGSWQEIRAGLDSGACDVATLSLADETWGSGLDHSPPYITETLAMVTPSNTGFIEDLRALPTVSVGYVVGYIDSSRLEKTYPTLNFLPFETLSSALDSVEDNSVYGVLDSLSVLNYELQQRPKEALKVGGIFSDERLYFGLSTLTSAPLLGSAVKKTIEAMPDALMTNTHRKWVAVTVEKQTDYTLFWQALMVGGVLLLILLARFKELKRHREEIQQKNLTLREINSQLEQQHDSALHMAYHDQLTGLPNRAKLMQDLDQAMKLRRRTTSSLAVLFIDLDRFKSVNDTLGHAIGDRLLKRIANVIRSLLRDSDLLCRMGGDEFVVVLQDISDHYSPSLVAQRIIDELDKTFVIDNHNIDIGSSVGIALSPEDSDDLNEMIKFADSAMYTAKETGRNGFAYYREEMSNKAARRTQIETALRRSLKEQDFSLVFQPIVDLETRKVVKAEALIRWNHDELGFVPPDEFIPIAEEFGLIVNIGEWVLRRSCESMLRFIDEGVEIESIAVNVSSVEFIKGDITSRFQSVLSEYAIRPDQIEIEITERHMLEPSQGAENQLQKLRELGHTLCVDDFGTGYSSLSYMKQLPLNVIKIDRSFISDIPHDQNDVAISQAIISLSHNLGYKVVAEGVETQEQLDYLMERCCNYAQGYYLSRPVSADDFAQTVQEISERLTLKGNWTSRLRALRV